jgi:hypothetical protein
LKEAKRVRNENYYFQEITQINYGYSPIKFKKKIF